ncbi:hypothetical protein [Massilia sp. ZL223]|uniref:hypothetical protein n=1 Tax=Massilia sp. ZL223 TaxID=2824904 RepID=UPI001B817886|nr:hypothetical protein [Massilia sp. ZL223]MBQ5963190.1 hypothetical protein [Massilia sp. ZL223]
MAAELNIEAERREFEAWAGTLDVPNGAFDRWPDGRYVQEVIEDYWSGWQAARRASSSASKELPPSAWPAPSIVDGPRDYYSTDKVREILAADRIARQGEPVAWRLSEREVRSLALEHSIACKIGVHYEFDALGLDAFAIHIMNRCRAAIQAAAPADAPTEPTKEMIAAGARYLQIMSCPELEAKQIYLAMRAAAPNASRAPAEDAREQQPVPPDNLPRWIDDLKGKDPTIDGLIEYIISFRAAPEKAAGEQEARAVVPEGVKEEGKEG